MTLPIKHVIASSLLVATIALGGIAKAEMVNMAQEHMGHVTDSWGDTPEETGLLPTAIAEAEIAAYHAGVAASQTDDLVWMQDHAKHVLHAIDPDTIAAGPGLGYGVLRGAAGTAKHITIAAHQQDASENVKIHSVHVATSAKNTVARIAVIKGNIAQILAADTAGMAAPAALEMAMVSQQLLAGYDANGDGEITWDIDEGGLNASAKHMQIMRAGEGL